MISYRITALPAGHRYGIRQVFAAQATGECRLYLPVWIPGSYMRRDFARLLYGLKAWVNGRETPVIFRSPSAWSIEAQAGAEVALEYEVYARDLSVRGNYLDHQRGFFNPCAACIAVEGGEHGEHRLVMHQSLGQIGGAPESGGAFVFRDYDHLIDTPLMLGAHLAGEFSAGGVPHRILISGATAAFDAERLVRDIEAVCHAAIALFGELPQAVQRYDFLLHLTDSGYGGLEHRASTLLMASRHDLPAPGMEKKSAGYIQLLGLFSHEYFHTWNVKDLKPRDFQPYQLQAEQPTEMLWLFEGFTAYFDDWLLLRAGVISAEEYHALLARNISAYWQRRGKAHQTLAQSSFEAWTKLYNGGENTANASISYYGHGALFAFCLDAWLHQHGGTSLAAILAALWQKYRADGVGLTESSFTDFVLARLPQAQHDAFRTFMTNGLHSTTPLPLIASGKIFGLTINAAPDNGNRSECGFRWQGADMAVQQLDPESAAARAGLAVDDRIIAVNHLKASPERLRQWLLTANPETPVTLHIFRDGVLHDITFPLAQAPAHTCTIHNTHEVKP
ncbi:MAG: PDZ domain-containing protein [Cardiobacteriaceae bacterium]|nr:PDZ domain-containing protein [Cardiobacteriaceae bacterium]